ncbi:erythromycin esterase family protein [Kribbella sandramycini]|uniref:Erythromycin esterase family protein n=1 Tax=Kribbella sandramycini TaxID=60450 RepID=A0A7Y4L0I5_9ACTN|nr:erythromycin esterase family protein [Kribbella sandramycini]MBB6565821.1 erythromycin esterase-like protein [Kribbella sandramycini]NOL42085.1 erythromycin esterase family protein [Kribbella sandramycini]
MTATAVLDLITPKPRLLAVGEPTHREEELLDLRNSLFRELVEDEGYRAITLESDCLMGLVVDDYVTSGVGDLDDVMATGFSHQWGGLRGNRELVQWMRSYNEGRALSDQVRFAGFDGPLETEAPGSPRQALTSLYSYLSAATDLPCTADTLNELLGADDRWTNPAAMMDPTQSIGRSDDVVQLRRLAADLAALLTTETPALLAESTVEAWHRARLYARTAEGLLRYHYWYADTTPRRITHLLAQRDAMMAANLRHLSDRFPTLAFGHNAHFQRDKSSMHIAGANHHWWSAGALVDARLGDRFKFVATAIGTIESRGVDAPPSGTLEAHLYANSDQRQVHDPRKLAAIYPPRVSPWFGYAALDPAQLPRLDGLLFVKDL